MRLGRQTLIPWLIGGGLILCLWCSMLTGIGGWIMGQDLARREAQALQATNTALQNQRVLAGVLVTRLDRDGPAAIAGLQIGDTILAINNVNVASARELREQLNQHMPGELVTLKIFREREELIYVRLQSFPNDSLRCYLGIYYTARGEEPADL
jgi:PDZ domain-containing secreted protein